MLMRVYNAKKKSDGTLELLPDQISELKSHGHASEQIFSALLKLYEESSPDRLPDVALEPLPPCGECGGDNFLRTGNCHVCRTCGASQGCS